MECAQVFKADRAADGPREVERVDNRPEALQRLVGYDAVDTEGNRIGPVESVWVDGATEQLEFVAVKTGTLMGRTHIVPTAAARIDDGERQVRVPYSADQIKGAPHFDENAELSEDDEQQVYGYYGIGRSTAPSPTGLAGRAGGMTGAPDHAATTGRETSGQETTGRGTTGRETSGQAQQTIPLAEEQLHVGKREVEAGRARLRKVVRTEHVSQPVELRREEVTVERVPASGQEVPSGAFQEQEIEVPLRREEPVVEKEARVTGQVRVDKTVETEQDTVEGEVRREDVQVDREGQVDVRGADRQPR